MSSLRNVLFFGLCGSLFSASAIPPSSTPPPTSGKDKLVIVGDSTACEYDHALMPYRGWGEYIQPYLKPGLEVVNLAKPGRSTKTYMIEGSWKRALREHPKFVLIQFGTNDAHSARTPEGVDAEVNYRQFLQHYIDSTLKAGAIPVLISPAHPRAFTPDGKMIDQLGAYVTSMKRVAETRGVAMVDLYAASGEFFERIGPEKCRQFEPYPTDNVHFNPLAAKAMAELIMRRLPRVEPRIQPFLGPDPKLLTTADEDEKKEPK